MTEPVCPECGSRVRWMDTCHTWPGPEGSWMSCMGCGSASHYYCDSDDCDWTYDHGLNPRNPRSEENEAKKPAWLDGWGDTEFSYPGTISYWNDDE